MNSSLKTLFDFQATDAKIRIHTFHCTMYMLCQIHAQNKTHTQTHSKTSSCYSHCTLNLVLYSTLATYYIICWPII